MPDPAPEGQSAPEPKGWQDWALGQTRAVLATVVGAVGTLGFVAFVGGALLWARARALDLPAEKVIAVAPREDLVAAGASTLALFAVAGIAATGMVYLFDHCGRPCRLTRLNLLALLTIGLTVAIVYADPSTKKAIWSAVVLVPVLALLVSFIFWRRVIVVPPPPPSPEPSTPPPPPPYSNDWPGLRDSILKGVREWGAGVSKPGAESPGEPTEDQPKRPDEQAARSLPPNTESFRISDQASAVLLFAVVLAVGCIQLIYGDWWVTVSVGLAFVVYLVTIGVARASGSNFGGTAAAVLIGVTFYGAAISVLRYWEDKPIQPMVALRMGEVAPVCGAYLVETDERIYFARLERGNSRGEGSSNHLFWIDRKQATAWALGPLQDRLDAEAVLKRLRRRVLDERRANVTSSEFDKGATSTPKPRATDGRTKGDETKTVLPPKGDTTKPACSIYTG